MKRKYKVIGFSLLLLGFVLAVSTFGNRATAQQKSNSSQENIHITNQAQTLTIYPVPVTTTVHVRISPALRPNVAKIEIISLIGRKVTEQALLNPNTTDVAFTNMSQYPSGVYMVLARDQYGKIVKSAKMVINR